MVYTISKKAPNKNNFDGLGDLINAMFGTNNEAQRDADVNDANAQNAAAAANSRINDIVAKPPTTQLNKTDVPNPENVTDDIKWYTGILTNVRENKTAYLIGGIVAIVAIVLIILFTKRII
ncbi:MAG: hypothetical protein JXR68_13045 [Bacteroidales bacterium]|nr:hypothetical protein [Bacteroidales bacterium]